MDSYYRRRISPFYSSGARFPFRSRRLNTSPPPPDHRDIRIAKLQVALEYTQREAEMNKVEMGNNAMFRRVAELTNERNCLMAVHEENKILKEQLKQVAEWLTRKNYDYPGKGDSPGVVPTVTHQISGPNRSHHPPSIASSHQIEDWGEGN